MTVLEQTKGKFKLEGKIKGISNENALNEGFTGSDKPYKSLSFFIETSPVNKVKVELFAMEWDEVTGYSQKAKESKKIKWDKRHENHGDYKVMGVNLFLEPSGKGDGKHKRAVLVEWDAIDYILKNLKEGDSVRVNGEPSYQNYEDQEGQKKESVRFSFRSISKTDEIDFEAENFEEVAIFEQEIVAIDTMIDDESKKLLISAHTITYKGKETPTATFVVDGSTYPRFANNMAKRLQFGDFIKVFGKIINSSIREEAEPDADLATDDDDWGGDTDIQSSFNQEYITTYVNELQVTGVDSGLYVPKKYKDEDFFSKGQDAFDGNVEDGEDFGEEEEIEDLPFG